MSQSRYLFIGDTVTKKTSIYIDIEAIDFAIIGNDGQLTLKFKGTELLQGIVGESTVKSIMEAIFSYRGSFQSA